MTTPQQVRASHDFAEELKHKRQRSHSKKSKDHFYNPLYAQTYSQWGLPHNTPLLPPTVAIRGSKKQLRPASSNPRDKHFPLYAPTFIDGITGSSVMGITACSANEGPLEEENRKLSSRI